MFRDPPVARGEQEEFRNQTGQCLRSGSFLAFLACAARIVIAVLLSWLRWPSGAPASRNRLNYGARRGAGRSIDSEGREILRAAQQITVPTEASVSPIRCGVGLEKYSFSMQRQCSLV